jgi:phosphatidylglycerophosphate synthase
VIKGRMGSDFDRVILRVLPFVARLRVQPDLLTILGVAIAFGAGVAFTFEYNRLAGLILLASGLCDIRDGAVARSQGTTSRAGAFFDSSLDRVGDLAALGGIALAQAGRADVGGVLLVLWALGGSFMTSYTRARAEAMLARLDVGLMERAERFGILVLGALTGWLEAALWVVAVGSTITSIQRLVVARRHLRELERTGRDPTALEPAPGSGADAGSERA